MVDLQEKNLVKMLVKSCKSLIAFIILASPILAFLARHACSADRG